ncbi:MAG: dimethylargininase [Deltaproteobacteria bacterium]|nr:dimethylargininase [Deltaproteobacteria bacterium]
MVRALTRHVPSSFANALSAVPPDSPIDVALARQQHLMYCMALAECGATVTTLPVDERCPDSVFVEDTAVVVDKQALITRPGAPTRQLETAAVAVVLDAWLNCIPMTEPATLDGGDCMLVGRTMYVGRSARTNAAGIAQLARAFAPRGIDVVPIDLPAGVLHLKCVCSPLGGGRILLADDSIDRAVFRGLELVAVPAQESYAANAVAIDKRVIIAAGFPRTHEALAKAGFKPYPVPCSEVRKADGSLTCQSIVF